jgi:DNA repair protein SbcD/Mre11
VLAATLSGKPNTETLRGPVRLLLFSDLHLDAPFAWADREIARARRTALRETLTNIAGLAREERVDALLSGGDLYEQDRFTPDTAAFLRETFAALAPMPVLLAPGNHDWYGEHSLYRQVEWTPNVHVFAGDRLTPYVLTDGLTLWGAGHRAPANTDGFLGHGFHVDRAGTNLALFHGSERSELAGQEAGKAPHAPFTADQIPAAGLQHAFCGHFHTPKDGRWHTYPGNPDPLSFGEAGERGAVVAEVSSNGSLTRSRHRVAASTVHDLPVDLTGVAHADAVCARVEAAVRDLRGCARVTLYGEVAPEVDVRLDDLRRLPTSLDALVPRVGRLRVGYDLDELRAERSVRGQFVRDVEAATDLDEGARRRVLVTGLRALDGRSEELEVL